MKKISVNRWVLGWVFALSLVLGMRASEAADHSRFEGVWTMKMPQTLLHPVSGAIPFTEEGKKTYDEHVAAAAKGDFEFDTTMSRCSSPGLPRIMLAPGRFKIYVRDDIVLMRFEWNRLFRQASMSAKRRQPLPPEMELPFDRDNDELLYGTMIGKSYGRWEGQQLVIESDGFAAKLLDNLLPNSEDLKLVEHLRLIDNNTLEDRIRIEDSTNYTQPWETVLTYRRVADEPFPEDVCLDRKRDKQVVWPR